MTPLDIGLGILLGATFITGALVVLLIIAAWIDDRS